MTRTILFCAAVAIASIATTYWVLWIGLAPDDDVHVTFDELKTAIESGAVHEVHIQNQTYRFRVGGVSKQAAGPSPDIALVRSLRPSGIDERHPDIYFDP